MRKSIYYLGNKASFSEKIIEAIDRVDPSRGRLCDLFAGTGAVAFAAKSSRAVTTVDIQEYSRVICSAQLNPVASEDPRVVAFASGVVKRAARSELHQALMPLIELEDACAAHVAGGNAEMLVDLMECDPLLSDRPSANHIVQSARERAKAALGQCGLLESGNSTIATHYGGVYFSYRQAADLDIAATLAAEAHPDVRDTLTAAVASAASTVVNTVGKHFAQPIRPRDKSGKIKLGTAAGAVRDRGLSVSDSVLGWLKHYGSLPQPKFDHACLRMDYREGIRTHGGDFSVVYADPPYTRDHYSRFYHVLETICLRDRPGISTIRKNGQVQLTRGAYRTDRHQSPFCIRSEAKGALDALLKATAENGTPLVLSYSPHEEGDGTHPRVLSASDIESLARMHYPSVHVSMIVGSSHNMLNRADLELRKREHAEMLVECKF